MTTFILACDGTPLMPTTNCKKVHKLLRSGRAVIAKHRPFTIRLMYETTKNTQPVEIGVDAGYTHIGVSVKSEKHEYASEQYDLLQDEKERHRDCRQYRGQRRSRKHHRAPRFDNRTSTKKEGWLAPSLKNKADRHIDIVSGYASVLPKLRVIIETGQFDTQVLNAVENGLPLPSGVDYQRGLRYGYETLREAVFARDGYKCKICKKGIGDGVILRMHHVGFWKEDRSNRMSNLMTVCCGCHTSKNHKPGGKLYGFKPVSKGFAGAAFMNSVKYYIYNQLRESGLDVRLTYGAHTKLVRKDRNIEKSHANDAYCIGEFYPKHRCKTSYYKKKRRNNRILEKFYDAKYIDSRDGSKKSGSQLFNGRTTRSHEYDTENLHKYRKQKISKGRRSIRRTRYEIQLGDTVIYEGKKYIAGGCGSYGTRVILKDNGKNITVSAKKS